MIGSDPVTPARELPPAGEPVPSPCVRICALDPATRICSGCGRTLAEIARWSGMTDNEKRAILRRVAPARAGAGAPQDGVLAPCR